MKQAYKERETHTETERKSDSYRGTYTQSKRNKIDALTHSKEEARIQKRETHIRREIVFLSYK